MRREDKPLTVRDGRRVWAQLSGPTDGDPVFIHMGTPGSRQIWEGFVEAGADRGLRHICCSRPGYEGSDRQPGRSFADVAADIEDVADGLGVDEFYVVGISTGANFALACAALLPRRVRGALAMAAFAPRGAEGLDWTAGMVQSSIEEFRAIEAGPAALEAFIAEYIRRAGAIRSGAELVAGLRGWVKPVDVEAVEQLLLETALVDNERLPEGFWGWYEDDWAIWGDWGFDPAKIEVPVSLWHGGQDVLVPVSHGIWLAGAIPGACSHILPELGHMSLWARSYGDALDELLELGRK